MNKFIITEEQLNIIRESVEIKNIKLPDFIAASVNQNKTSLGRHPSFPPESGMRFEDKILKKRYFELLTNVKKVDGINGDISKKSLLSKLMELVIRCKSLEEPIKNDLEKICFEFVNDTFGIKYGDLNIECVLTDKIDINQPIVPKDILEDEFEDVDHIDNLTNEIMKRRLIDSLVQGACVRLSSNYEKILNKIYTLDQRLPELYYNITAINEYLSFVKEKKPSDDNIGGAVAVNLTSEEPEIHSEAIIFPTLVFETIKGVMELISSNGLPDDMRDAQYIISQADFLLAENWDKRFGVGLWDILMDTIKPENTNLMPNVFTELVTIPTDKFDKVMREIFAKTKKGKSIIESIVDEVSTSQKFNEIDNTLQSQSENDEFFTPEELIAGDKVHETDTSSAGDYGYDVPAFLDAETADHRNMISNSIPIQEAKDYYDFYDDQSDMVNSVISEFLNDKQKGIAVKHWRTIPAEQYQNALLDFMKYGSFMRFPTKYVFQWAALVTKNTLDLEAITELAGHSQGFPYDEFCSAFGFEKGTEEYEKYSYNNWENCSEYLSEIGFYDWCQLPDGSDAWSDYGMEPLYKLIKELEEQETAEQKIIVINKILDVYHQRGDLASAFIQGGSKSLNQISFNEMKLKTGNLLK